MRKENALRGMVDDNGDIMKTEEEVGIQHEINRLKVQYQIQYNELKELKSEIERIQRLLEQCRQRLQKDFEKWMMVMVNQGQKSEKAALNSSQTTGVSSNITDQKVVSDLEAFYKKRDEIYNAK
jgi:kinesin family protein 6/9